MGSVGLDDALDGARAIFLDRDGVINKNIFYSETSEWEAPLSAADFVLVDGALAAMHALQAAGFLLFVVSNQPNAAKGKATMETLGAIHRRLLDELSRASIRVEAFYYCYHHPHGVVASLTSGCDCRKPSPYFLLKAAADFNLDLGRCWMIGDRESDVICGQSAGTRTVKIIDEIGNSSEKADYNAADLAAAAHTILKAPVLSC